MIHHIGVKWVLGRYVTVCLGAVLTPILSLNSLINASSQMIWLQETTYPSRLG